MSDLKSFWDNEEEKEHSLKCVGCDSVAKLKVCCNSCYQELKVKSEKLGRLEKWLNKKYDENWFVLTNNKDLEEARIIRNFIREVRGVLENDC